MANPFGVVFPDKEKGPSWDIDRLIEGLKAFEDSLDNNKKGSKKGSSPNTKKNPKDSDLLRKAPLEFLIPTGFLMIHSDIQDILKVLKKSKGGSSSNSSGLSWEGVANTGIKSAATLAYVGLGVGVLKEWTKGMNLNDIFESITTFASNAIDLLPKAGKAVQETGLNVALLFKDIQNLSQDEDIKKIHKSSQSSYLVAYYSDMMKNLGYELNYTMNTSTGIPEIQGISPVSNEQSKDSVLNKLEEDAPEIVGHLLTKGAALKAKAWSETIIDTLSDNAPQIMATTNLLFDEETKATMGAMSSLYAQASVANIIRGMGLDIDFSDPKNPKLKGFISEATTMDYVDKFMDVAKETVGHYLTGGIGLGIEAIASSVSDAYANIASSIAIVGNLEDNPYIKEYTAPLMGKYAAVIIKDLMNNLGYDVDINDPSFKVTKITAGSRIKELNEDVASTNNFWDKVVVATAGATDVLLDGAKSVFKDVGESVSSFFSGLGSSSATEMAESLLLGSPSFIENSMNNYLDNISSKIEINVNESLSSTINSSSEKIIENMTSLGILLGDMARSLNLLSTINTTLKTKADEIRDSLPSYIPVPTGGGGSPSSTVSESDMVRTGG